MPFRSPAWVPDLEELDTLDSISIPEFLNNEAYGRYAFKKARKPFTCGVTGKSYTAEDVVSREQYMARAIGKRLSFADEGADSQWSRVVGLFSLNTVDYAPLTHAVHLVGGIVVPASPSYSASELEHQLRASNVTALFTCLPLLETAVKAALAVGIHHERIFILPLPNDELDGSFKTIEDLVEEGKSLPPVEPAKWSKGQGKRQIAYLCFSSGTSGLPKAVMVSHFNVIANVLQLSAYEGVSRKKLGVVTQVATGFLPFHHIYGLVCVGHLPAYRGDEVVVLPSYSFTKFLETIQRFQIEHLNIVPPILVQMVGNHDRCREYDLSSVRSAFSGGAPLARETISSVLALYPQWHICQAYGMTETATIISTTSELDIWPGSAGSLLPSVMAKIFDQHGKEVRGHGTPGELYIQGPAVVPGYLNNEKATAETFVWDDDGRWIRTGDEAMMQKSPAGNDHLVIVDRIKELIKVKGIQVAPAELEAHLLTHSFVSDCAVIQVPHPRSGEVPKAIVVLSNEATHIPPEQAARDICEHVERHKARHKWLAGGVEFIDVIPKSPTGKILRRVLREQEKQTRAARGARL